MLGIVFANNVAHVTGCMASEPAAIYTQCNQFLRDNVGAGFGRGLWRHHSFPILPFLTVSRLPFPQGVWAKLPHSPRFWVMKKRTFYPGKGCVRVVSNPSMPTRPIPLRSVCQQPITHRFMSSQRRGVTHDFPRLAPIDSKRCNNKHRSSFIIPRQPRGKLTVGQDRIRIAVCGTPASTIYLFVGEFPKEKYADMFSKIHIQTLVVSTVLDCERVCNVPHALVSFSAM